MGFYCITFYFYQTGCEQVECTVMKLERYKVLGEYGYKGDKV